MIVRGFIIPVRGVEDKPTYTQIISDQEASELYECYKQIIRHLLGEFVKKRKAKLQNADDVNAFLNFLVLFLRGALYVDTIPDVIPSIAGQLHLYFLDQFVDRVKKGTSPDLLPESYFEWLRKRVEDRSTEKSIERENDLCDSVRRIFNFPADSRPGANTSSLLVHTLTVSGLACCKYIKESNVRNDKELAILRLTCLFHDIGKFRDWFRHEEISAMDLKELFKGFVQGDAEDLVREAAELIPRDVKVAGPFIALKKLYMDADASASSIDRVSKYFLRMLSEDMRKLVLRRAQEYLKISTIDEKTFIEKCYTDWNFWNRYVPQEDIVKLTEDFCKNAGRISKDNPLLARSEEDSRPLEKAKGVEVVRFDVRNIQGIVKVNDLRTMAGGSMIVDFTIFVGLHLALIFEAGLPAEVVLSFGGGNVFVLLPSNYAQEIIRKVREIVRQHCKISLTIASHEILSSFAETLRRIEAEVMKKKLSEEEYISQSDAAQPYGLNIFDVCDVCNSKPPSREVGGKLYCDTCYSRRYVGDHFHFLYKLSMLGYRIDEVPHYLDNIMEYIAGASEEEILTNAFKEYKNVAALRFDANVVGAFMGSSISITDAFERSIRIDYSMKKVFRTFLDSVKDIDRTTYNRIVLGTVYMGGDDAFLLVPSKVAPYLAAFLINEFYLEMGCRLTLSCGIAVSKPKHPLIPLYEAAGYLLEEVVKNGVRWESYKKYEQIDQVDEFRGSLAFYTIDGGFMSPEGLDEVLKRLYDNGVSRQYEKPYIIAEPSISGSFLVLLQLISTALHKKSGGSYSLRELKKAIERDLRAVLIDQESSSNIKNLIATIKRDVNIELIGDRSVRLQVVFAKRQSERFEDKRDIISGILQTLELRDNSIRLDVADALILAKVVLGE
ncbi:MAG: hypothetical protein NZ931_06005 [Aigarchaeota archaeon]|nr:hypothetical protein [Aigarchaeota archaeon]